MNKSGNQTWIDGITDIDSQALNNIENALNDLNTEKISFPNDYNSEDGSVLIKNGNSIVFGDPISSDNFYDVSKMNTILYGEDIKSNSITDFTSKLKTENKHIAGAINELLAKVLSAVSGPNSEIETINENIVDIRNVLALISRWLEGNDNLSDTFTCNDTYKNALAAINGLINKVSTLENNQSSSSGEIDAIKPLLIKNLSDGISTNSLIQKATNKNSAGISSIALGEKNNVTGKYSLSDGYNNSSTGDYSYSLGNNLISNANQLTLGQYNTSSTDSSLIVGNGTSTKKENILDLKNTGNLSIKGIVKDISASVPNNKQILSTDGSKLVWINNDFNTYSTLLSDLNTNKDSIDLAVSNALFYDTYKTDLKYFIDNKADIKYFIDNKTDIQYFINNKTDIQYYIDNKETFDWLIANKDAIEAKLTTP